MRNSLAPAQPESPKQARSCTVGSDGIILKHVTKETTTKTPRNKSPADAPSAGEWRDNFRSIKLKTGQPGTESDFCIAIVSRYNRDTELESGIRIPKLPRFVVKTAESGIPIAIQSRYGTQYGIPHSPRIAIRNWSTERLSHTPSEVFAAQVSPLNVWVRIAGHKLAGWCHVWTSLDCLCHEGVGI